MKTLPPHGFQLFAQTGNSIIDPPAVDLKPGFSRSPGPDPTSQPGQGIITGGEHGQHVFQLGHLNLQLSFPGFCPSCKDIENQLGPVYNPEIGMVGDRANLGGAEILIKEQQIGTETETHQHNLHQFAATENETGMNLFPSLDDPVQDLHPG